MNDVAVCSGGCTGCDSVSFPAENHCDKGAGVLRPDQHLAIVKFLLDLIRRGQQTAECDLETFFVALCMAQGHLEKRPLDLSGISALTGLDRKTVTRRLATLEGMRKVLLVRKGRRTIVFRRPMPSSAKWLSFYKRMAADMAGLVCQLNPIEILQGPDAAACLNQQVDVIWSNGTNQPADAVKRDTFPHDKTASPA
jgi:hypothetical protein